ncbi:MAG TPA: glycosyltransferase [Terriglobales bacterium]|nr:glycosyltransferase [Terriglobales bacterium]
MRIAMIGLKALPPRYGGFETAADEISRRLVALGHEVIVYNRAGLSAHEGDDYEGVKLVTLPTINRKNLSSITHSLLSTLHVLFHRVDVVQYFITGNTLFAPLAKLAGMKTVCSVDGTDWQRRKWGPIARAYLRFSERLAVWFCDALIGDSPEVVRYYRQAYNAEPVLSFYGIRETQTSGKQWLERFHLQEREYVLFVGRLVPENNIHDLIAAFEKTDTDKKLVIVGDDPWGKRYVRSLQSTTDKRIIFTGGLYGEGYEQLQQNAYMFVLPDEVGGTHPSLVEAMGFGNCVLVNDTQSNLEAIGDAGFFYRGAEGHRDLACQLKKLLDDPALVAKYRDKARQHAMANYRWSDVVREHEKLYRRLLGFAPEVVSIPAARSASSTAD